MTRIGTGFVSIEADFGPFWRDVARELGGASDLDRVGRDSGNRFARAFTKGSTEGRPLAGFESDLGRTRDRLRGVGDAAGKDFASGVSRGLDPARSKLNAFARDGAASFKTVGDSARRASNDLKRTYQDISRQNISRAMRDIERDAGRGFTAVSKLSSGFKGLLGSFGGGGGGGGLKGASRDMGAFGAAAGGATATIGGFRIALAALVPIAIGFGGAITSAVAALGPLVGLAAAAGNALAAAGQGMGVFALATMGVADALKEQIQNQTRAASAAISNAAQQRAAARAIQTAQDGIRQAARSLDEAFRDQRTAVAALGPAYTAARRRLTDLREAATDSALALRGARLAANDARRALADLLRGPDPRKLADAHRAVTDALRGEEDAVLALSDAHRALDELLKPADALDVADATDRVADAIRGEERARLDLNEQLAETNAILANPASSEADRARARLQLADAENAVDDAVRESARARARLSELEAGPAQAEVADARRRISDAEYAVAQAAQRTADARADLAEVEKPAAAQEIAQARLNVALAENALGDAQRDRLRATRDLAAAEEQGITGAEEVVQAREQIRQADLAMADAERDAARAAQALRDAQIGAREATARMGLAAQDMNEKMRALPAPAREFVRTLIDIKPRLDAIRNTAAAGFFPGATEGLRAAMGSFNEVNAVVEQTSTVLGEAARKSGELVGSPAFGRDIEIIGGRNAKVIDTLGEALRHVVSALRHVMVAAGPLTQWLADTVNDWALQAAAAAKSGRETGRLADFFEKTRAVTQRLFSIIGHLTSGLIGLGSAGFKTGNDIWASIDHAARRFDEWANSEEGRRKLQDFFQRTKDLAAALLPVLGGITSALTVLSLKILPLITALRILGPLTDEAVTAFVAFKVATYAWAVAAGVATFATGGWVTAFWSLNAALVALTGPVGITIAIVAALAAGFVLAWKHSETFRSIVTGVFNAVRSVASATLGWLASYVSATFERIRGLFSFYTGLWRSIITAAWGAIRTATTAAWDAISGGLAAAWAGIRSAAGAAWGLIRSAIVDPFRSAVGAVSDLVGGMRSRVGDVFRDIVGFARDFGKNVASAVTTAFAGVGGIVADFAIQILKVIDLIPGVSMKDEIKGVRGGAHSLGFAGYARGGLYAASGGVVDQPMVIAGEEAPRHPEFVIPTNPAYRDRARMLLMQAAKGIGFARGGMFSKSELVALWKRANDGLGDATVMAAIALAESSGDSRAHNPSGASGLWQILGKPFPGDAYDPLTNARMAGAKLRTQGLDAWVAYTNGSYKQFMGDYGGGILGAITGALGSLLSKGAEWLLGKLPGVGGLPDWLKGTGTWILEHVTGWIKDKVSDVIGLGGGSGDGGGLSKAIQAAMALARDMGLQITSTTGGNHVSNSWHDKGRAADFAGSPAQMAAFYRAALARWDGSLLELFYDPVGAIDSGHAIPAVGGHSDHVHIALAEGGTWGGSFETGGVVPGPIGAPRLIEAHAGEMVLPSGMQLHADIYIGGQRIDERVDVRLEMRDRQRANQWDAGVLR